MGALGESLQAAQRREALFRNARPGLRSDRKLARQ